MSNFLNSENLEFGVCSTTPSFRAAIDVGSTQTRSCVYTMDFKMHPAIVLDSNYDIVTRDISHIESPENTIAANLDMTITDLSSEQKVKPMLTTEHVIKGDLLGSLTTSTQITVASASKIDQKTTYVNIISNLAVLLLQEYQVMGVPANMVNVSLAVALPPEDTKHKSRIDVFKERLAGEYEVVFHRLNVTLKFKIADSSIIISSEPEAVAAYQTMNEKLEDTDNTVVCVLDVGGRSAGVTFISDKHLLLDSCATINLGGARMAAIFSRNLVNTLNIQEPLIPRVMKSFSTATYRLGAQTLNVAEQLNSAKKEFSELLFNEFLRAVDTNDIQLQDISRVFCSGRTFGEAPGSPSIMHLLSEMFKEKAAYTDFELVEGDNPLLVGICLKGMSNG